MDWEAEELFYRDPPWKLLNDPRLTSVKKINYWNEPATQDYWIELLFGDGEDKTFLIDTRDFFCNNKKLQILKGGFCHGQILDLIPFWQNLTEINFGENMCELKNSEWCVLGREVKNLIIFRIDVVQDEERLRNWTSEMPPDRPLKFLGFRGNFSAHVVASLLISKCPDLEYFSGNIVRWDQTAITTWSELPRCSLRKINVIDRIGEITGWNKFFRNFGDNLTQLQVDVNISPEGGGGEDFSDPGIIFLQTIFEECGGLLRLKTGSRTVKEVVPTGIEVVNPRLGETVGDEVWV
jgi:hypothetical protein